MRRQYREFVEYRKIYPSHFRLGFSYFFGSYSFYKMEVIINYYGEEYPCLIRPDKTVKENKVEIAV